MARSHRHVVTNSDVIDLTEDCAEDSVDCSVTDSVDLTNLSENSRNITVPRPIMLPLLRRIRGRFNVAQSISNNGPSSQQQQNTFPRPGAIVVDEVEGNDVAAHHHGHVITHVPSSLVEPPPLIYLHHPHHGHVITHVPSPLVKPPPPSHLHHPHHLHIVEPPSPYQHTSHRNSLKVAQSINNDDPSSQQQQNIFARPGAMLVDEVKGNDVATHHHGHVITHVPSSLVEPPPPSHLHHPHHHSLKIVPNQAPGESPPGNSEVEPSGSTCNMEPVKKKRGRPKGSKNKRVGDPALQKLEVMLPVSRSRRVRTKRITYNSTVLRKA